MDGVGVVVVGGKRGSFRERAEGQSHTRSCGRGRRARARRCTRRHGAVCSALREPRKVDCFVRFFGRRCGSTLFLLFLLLMLLKRRRRGRHLQEKLSPLSCGIEVFFFYYSRNMHRRVPTSLRRSSVQLNVTFKIFFLSFQCALFPSLFFLS